MIKIAVIGAHSCIGKTVLFKNHDVIIVENTTSEDTINTESLVPIHNYTLANKITVVKTGKELRRERRKLERKQVKQPWVGFVKPNK